MTVLIIWSSTSAVNTELHVDINFDSIHKISLFTLTILKMFTLISKGQLYYQIGKLFKKEKLFFPLLVVINPLRVT